MKKLLTAALIIISLMLMLASCDSISDIIGGNDEPEITVSDDGYLVVDGVKTEHKVDNSTPGVIYDISDDDTYAKVVDYNGTDTNVRIAAKHQGLPVKNIYSGAFRGSTSITSVVIPDSVTIIDSSAFSDCTSLTSVTIPNSVTSIGIGAFSNCDSLTSINVGNENTTYKSINGNLYSKDGKTLIQYAMGKTDSSFIIPDSVVGLGDYAFSGCDSLTSMTIPNSVTSISDGAFAYCLSLTSVTIGNGVTSIGNSAFSNCDSLTSINVSDENTTYKSINGNLYSKDGKTLIRYAKGKTDSSFIIPDSVVGLGAWAFYNCDSLTSVTIPDSVVGLGEWTFAYCRSLTSITIPNSVVDLGNCAFSNCDSLTSVTIGNSVTSIGRHAFSNCDSLTSIKYRGTQAEWDAISKGSAWNSGTSNYTITYNYTEE